jgi:hypothetical protein
MRKLITIALRTAFLIGIGWCIDHFVQIGWIVSICLLSVIDRELDWLLHEKLGSRS